MSDEPSHDKVSGKVTPEEDATMRRLAWFERFGAELAPQLRVVKASIRSRDKRAAIREPEDTALHTTKGANRTS